MRTIALALCALLSACGGGSHEPPDPAPPPLHATAPTFETNTTVVFIGDSITQNWPIADYVPDAAQGQRGHADFRGSSNSMRGMVQGASGVLASTFFTLEPDDQSLVGAEV